MAHRKIQTIGIASAQMIVYRDAEWNQFIVKPVGERNEDRWYFTDDKKDAVNTAIRMAARTSLALMLANIKA